MQKERMIVFTIVIVLILMFGNFMVTIANSKDDKKQIIAIFSYTPDSPYTNEIISFNDESNNSNGIIVSWIWDFGDGNTSTERNPTHSYDENTTYIVSLEVTNNQGLSNNTSQHILVLNRKPIADFSYSPDNPTDLQTVNFTDLSTDTDGNITSWYWMFGDGNNSTTQNTTHRYDNDGTFTVTLNVTDNDNATNETSQQISILNVGPTSDFNYTQGVPTINETVQFTDTSTDHDGNVVSWLWDFGDGTNSTDKNSTHQYADNGTYIVTLTVTDDDEYNDSKEKIINITRAEDVESPSNVTGLTVTDAKDGKLNLAWNESTDNVAVDYYNIYHNGPDPSPIVVYHPTITYTHIGLTNGQEYTYNVSAVDTSGNEGEKSDSNSNTPTVTDSGGRTPGSGGYSPSLPTNQNPIANASAGEPYMGVIGKEIIFDGSSSNDTDGNITTWDWEFGDGTNGSGEIVTHVYSNVGTFTVVLTVIDNEGAMDSCDTVAVIIHPNIPPTTPEISGRTEGNKNVEYDYTFVSTDDNNDTIKYTVDWGDGTTDESGFLQNGTAFEVVHSWTSSGKYIVTIDAYDNQTSTSTEMIVMIDAIDAEVGYITDDDGDGTYDTFHSPVLETDLGQENGKYLIDVDGDGEWDYFFDLSEGISVYTKADGQEKTPIFVFVIVISVLLLVFLFKILWKRKDI